MGGELEYREVAGVPVAILLGEGIPVVTHIGPNHVARPAVVTQDAQHGQAVSEVNHPLALVVGVQRHIQCFLLHHTSSVHTS